ncbi:glycosyltransferase family 66 [Pyrenophora seminiperda CCB06]|uniref:Glycosyltransferase family 66 n=1 Tax=Pyrenophora seminiperda CCB06 TaxID=1302712 RepID=A0A3M7LXA2_9PLEO|nr:glycosyltransferase family 66 [Pyrenophora seminiperda CCB06]
MSWPFAFGFAFGFAFDAAQFPGLGAPPAAPTPPPAATSSVASFPGYQGGYQQAGYLQQTGYPQQAGYGLGGYGPNGIPQRPPPLGEAQTQQQGQQQGQQQVPSQAGYPPHPGYGQMPSGYNAQPPPPQGHNAAWPYGNQNMGMETQHNAYTSALVPASLNSQQEVVKSRSRQTSEQYQYQQYGQSQPAQAPPPQFEGTAVPVMLCHICSNCGEMRSAGYHRNNPVVPGKPLIPAPCRRCKKKFQTSYRSSSKYARVRKCSADEPCGWPREPTYDTDHGERRGRRRSREDDYITRYSPSRPRLVTRESSHGRMGLGVLQQPEQGFRTERIIKTSSLSPRPSSRYAGQVWPPPDIVRSRVSRSDEVYSAPPEPLPCRTSRTDEVWPPPDIVRTHSYRKVERSPSRRAHPRIIELSPSPPPRARSARIVHRSESQERIRKSLSVSPVRVSYREERRSEEAEARLMSHPQAYRPINPDARTLLRASDETCSNAESMSRHRLQSPSRRILKSSGTDRETSYRRRDSMRDSQQSMHSEVESPRVRFGDRRTEEEPRPESRSRLRYADNRVVSGDNHEQYREHSRHRVVDGAPPIPPAQDFERIRIRDSPPSMRKDYEDELRIDRQRRISTSPPRRFEQVRVRHTSPLPLRRTPRPPPSPERTSRSLYRHISRPRAMERVRSLTPPPLRPKYEEDHTDSDSSRSGEITEVRSWKGIDENGKPATFVEERKTVRMIDQGSDRGGLAREYQKMRTGQRFGGGERVATRSWRDV